MRINVYAEEMTADHEWVQKEANGHTFYGLRIFLASAPELHNEPGDDDRTAITFWARHAFEQLTGMVDRWLNTARRNH